MIWSWKALVSLSGLLIAALLASKAASQAQAQSPVAASSDADATVTASSVCGKNETYESATADASKPSTQTIPFGKAPIELTIISTEPVDRPVSAKEASRPDFCWEDVLSVGVNVSTTGEVSSFTNGAGAFRGGGGGKLDPEVFARLEKLMDHLPDDGHRLPGYGNRIMVRVERGGNVTVRFYDRAHLPDEILEMIRLTGARVKVITPVFQADRVLTGEETQGLGLLPPAKARHFNSNTFSPDGSIGVVHDFVTKTLTVYKVTPSSANGWPRDKNDILRVIDEFWQPPVYGGYWVNTEFSPDGRWLLVTWGNRVGALLYDTSTWQPVTDPRLFPQSLKEYLPSPDWKLGVAVTNAGEALIWDQQSHGILSKLPGLGEFEPAPGIHDQSGNRVYDIPSAEIQSAAFSPDAARVAIYSGPDNVYKLRLSVWDVQSGKMLRGLWPVEWMGFPSGNPIWWNDGRWLIAPYSSQFSSGGFGLWDVETGHFLGSFGGPECNQPENPITSGTRLLQPCFTGKAPDGSILHDKVLEWDMDSVTKQIAGSGAN